MEKDSLNKTFTEIVQELLEALYLLDVLYDMFDGSAKECTMVSTIRKKVKFSFDNTDECMKQLFGLD